MSHEAVGDAEQLADRFMGQFNGFDEQTQKIFGRAMWAFLEAVGCYKDNHWLASSIMCRTTVDAVFFLAFVRTHLLNSKWQPIIDTNALRFLLDIPFPWWRLKKWGKDHLHLDKEFLKEAEKVRQYGNFAAHLAESLMREDVGDPVAQSRMADPDEVYESLNIVSQLVIRVMKEWREE